MNSQRRCFLQGTLMMAVGASALAQEDPARYPTRPIRVILQGAGGASDQTARSIQAVMHQVLGQPLVIESRPGASGNIAMELTAQSPADGYTVFLSTVAPAVNPALFKSMKVRPERDLRGVSLLVFTPTVLVAHPSFEANSIKELVALAKAKPGQIPFASSGTGAVTRMEMEKFSHDAGIQLVHVPYKGGASAAINDVLGGQVPMTMTTMPVVLQHVRAGKLKALAVTSAERQPLLPDVPTLAEQGYKSSGSQQWQALFVPAATPPAIVAKLHAAVVAAVNDPRVRKTFADAGQTPVVSKSPAEMDEFLRAEMKRWGELVKQLGITAD